MKANTLSAVLICLTTGFFITCSCYSQKWGGTEPTGLLTGWSLNTNGGLTSYFGDLSLHDSDFGAKLAKESGPAMSIILSKNIYKNAISLSGQLLAGKLEGQKGNISFTVELMEYNLHARIDFVDLFMLKRSHAFGIVGYAGAGQFLFSTKKVEINERIVKNFQHDTRVPEFVFFFGGGIYYKLNANLGFTVDLSIRQCQNDRLDDFVKNNDYDYYSYLSVGISYYITTFKREPLKNKARLANTSFLFRSAAHPAQ